MRTNTYYTYLESSIHYFEPNSIIKNYSRIFLLFFIVFIAINYSNGQTSQALHFDGMNDFVNLGDINEIDGISQMTLEAWIYPEKLIGNNRRLISKGNTGSFNNMWIFSQRVDTDELLFAMDDNASNSDGVLITDVDALTINTWTHVAVVFDGTKSNNFDRVEIYVNGTEVADADKIITGNFPPITSAVNVNKLVFGARSDGKNPNSNNFIGTMDEVRIWTRALSLSEIQTNMNCELTGSENGLEAYYQFNEGSPSANNAGVTNLPDISGNNHDGLLRNFALNGNTSNWVSPGGICCTDIDGDTFFDSNCGGLDCDDNDPNVFPGAQEICDGIDNDCNGLIDDDITFVGNVTFNTQSEVDAFLSCYSSIDGDLTIDGYMINNLLALSNLETITGFLYIAKTNVSDFSGLDNLSSIGGKFHLVNNSQIEDFTGVEALTNIGGDLILALNFQKLKSLSGLENLTDIGGNLLMYFNVLLTDCCAIEPLIPNNIGGTVFILAGASGCQSIANIQQSCNAMPIIIDEPISYEEFVTIDLQHIQPRVFPNPVKQTLNIDIGQPYENGNLFLFNLYGQLVFSKQIEKSATETLSVSNLPKGVYNLLIETDGIRHSEKIIVQ